MRESFKTCLEEGKLFLQMALACVVARKFRVSSTCNGLDSSCEIFE
jgi:hypothetical protein